MCIRDSINAEYGTKTDAMATEATLKRVFLFSDSKVTETVKNEPLTTLLLELVKEAGLETTDPKSKKVGNMLYEMAGYELKEAKKEKNEAFVKNFKPRREFLTKKISDGSIKSRLQFREAVKILSGAAEIDEKKFDTACGVGISVTKKDIEDGIAEIFKQKEAEIEKKGHAMFNPLRKQLAAKFKWAAPKDLIDALNAALLAKCGPKKKGGKGAKKVKKCSKCGVSSSAQWFRSPSRAPLCADCHAIAEKLKQEEEERLKINFHKPEDNPRCPPELLKKHLEETGGRVVTRFPPEPNGYLHIGHSKALNINFTYARKNSGWCYLRFDDTNPEKESQEYIDSIIDVVTWLGHTPFKVTYASDYFEKLYDYAVELIKKDKAFVCHETADDIHKSRELAKNTKNGRPAPSPWRNRPIEESLKLFADMRRGLFAEGECTLRMKQDLSNPNPCMWDHVAYRIKYCPHPHAGRVWCIYPTYDYTHCICDSIENITHSLCSLEFEVRKESYNWLLDALDIYRSIQIEYSRLNITYVVLSKRKLIKLVEGKYVNGWDDPRLPTLAGVRRRGFTPESINDFADRVGVTRSQNLQEYSLLEECLRQDLEKRAPRMFAVADPLKVTITNWPEDKVEIIKAPVHPEKESLGFREIPFSKVVYISRADFRLKDSKNYFRLAPGKEVRLKYAHIIKCNSVVKDANNKVIEVKASLTGNDEKKMKGTIHWVSESKECPIRKVTVRNYGRLFLSPNPQGTKDEPKNFIDDLNPKSLEVIPDVLVHSNVVDALKVGDRVQFEREGYYIVDQDTKGKNIVFNRIVPLKEDKNKD
eukprot:TRINITY_DN6812_c0_g1_i1.p1 TRINITY_DN6812_c0_g1~~TRINITY_DN6812_c0_g1_i1.p1  ORF type:complete len:816 (+),score=186.40 TRINITY_DN6812_c0_g1_i1:44-2491(+)